MSSVPGAVTSVRWSELFPWLILVRAARVVLMLRVIVLALVGVIVTQLGWSFIEDMLLDEKKVAPLTRLMVPPAAIAPGDSFIVPGLRPSTSTGMPLPGAGLAVDAAESSWSVTAMSYGGPLYRGWAWAMQPLARLHDAEGVRQWLGLALAGLWSIAVWALAGGAIARIAAVYLTYGETIGPLAALRSAADKWTSTAGAPALAFLSILIIALPLVLAGLLMRLSFFAFLTGVLWFVVLLFGIAIAVVAIGLAFGWPLMWSTVAAERSDAFDAISRAYAYVFQRPLHAVFYLLVAGILGLLAQAAVSLVVDASLRATDWAIEMGTGDERKAELHDPDSDSRLDRGAARSIRFWERGFRGLADSFAMAYLWPAATGIYLLLRRLIDSTDLGEIVFDDGPPQRGLPTLVRDPAIGVPRAADAPQPPAG